MSRKGNCYDNAPMESFWGSLKNEMIHQKYATRANAEAAIKEYIEIFYNRQRRHRALAMYRQHRSQRASENRRWLLETDVSIIDSTPQYFHLTLIRLKQGTYKISYRNRVVSERLAKKIQQLVLLKAEHFGQQSGERPIFVNSNKRVSPDSTTRDRQTMRESPTRSMFKQLSS
jgi:hypothetical protein